MSDAITVTARFDESPRFTLTVNKSGLGLGTVTSSPGGINCGLTCSARFDAGITVVLTAQAGPLSVFQGWSGGGCSGTASCVVTLGADTTATAGFRLLGLLGTGSVGSPAAPARWRNVPGKTRYAAT
jgi:hypothetical protein